MGQIYLDNGSTTFPKPAAVAEAMYRYLTESGIVAAQMNGSELIYDYVHNHVLRTAVNGTWGESLTSLPQGETTTYSHTVTLPAEWNADNCHIVAFACEGSGNRVVLQCNECSVIPDQTVE